MGPITPSEIRPGCCYFFIISHFFHIESQRIGGQCDFLNKRGCGGRNLGKPQGSV